MTLSNSLADLAERIRARHREARDAARVAAAKAIETGLMLREAKSLCPHGDWLPFLERAGIQERQAQRLMMLAGSGIKSDTVSDLGGIKAALEFIASWRLPEPGESLVIGIPWERGQDFAIVWPNPKRPGHFDTVVFREAEMLISIRPWPGEAVEFKIGEAPINFIWGTLEANLRLPVSRWSPTIVADPLDDIRAEAVRT